MVKVDGGGLKNAGVFRCRIGYELDRSTSVCCIQ